MTEYEPRVGDIVRVGKAGRVGTVVGLEPTGERVDVLYGKEGAAVGAVKISALKPRKPYQGDPVRILPPAPLTPSVLCLWTVDELSPGSATCIVKSAVPKLLDRRVRIDQVVPVDLSVLLGPVPEDEYRPGDVVWLESPLSREAVVLYGHLSSSGPSIVVRFTDDPELAEVKVKHVNKRLLKTGDTVRPRVGTSLGPRYLVVGSSQGSISIETLPGRSPLGWFAEADFVKVDPGPTAPPEPDDDGFPRWPDGELIKPGEVVHTLSQRREGTVVETRALLDNSLGAALVKVRYENGECRWPGFGTLQRGPLPPEEIEVSFSASVELLTQVIEVYNVATSGTDPKVPHLKVLRRMLDSLSADDAKKVGWPTS